MISPDALSMWTVYDHPRDYPHGYIARRFEIGRESGPVATRDVITSDDLGALRAQLETYGLTVLPRMRGDDPKIVEVWL